MKAWLALLLLAGPALAADNNHFPQPVRVGDLIGQKLIGPKESQPLLGYVEAVENLPGHGFAVRIKLWRLLPWRARSVTIPLTAVSFLGPQLALTGLTEPQLAALPPAAPPTPLAPDEIIRLDLVKPFH